MIEYSVEFYTKRLVNGEDAGPSGPFYFIIESNIIEEAALKAVEDLSKRKSIRYEHIWNAKLINNKREVYEILREGSWLVDFETGKRLSDLEEKLNQNQ